MIRHIVILNFKKQMQADYLTILENTKPLIEQIPGILKYQIYPNVSTYVPQNVESFGIEIVFQNSHALDIFMIHHAHYKANSMFEKYLSDPAYMVLTHKI